MCLDSKSLSFSTLSISLTTIEPRIDLDPNSNMMPIDSIRQLSTLEKAKYLDELINKVSSENKSLETRIEKTKESLAIKNKEPD
jgi:hypothetical protein